MPLPAGAAVPGVRGLASSHAALPRVSPEDSRQVLTARRIARRVGPRQPSASLRLIASASSSLNTKTPSWSGAGAADTDLGSGESQIAIITDAGELIEKRAPIGSAGHVEDQVRG
jgi:hypothetical protein